MKQTNYLDIVSIASTPAVEAYSNNNLEALATFSSAYAAEHIQGIATAYEKLNSESLKNLDYQAIALPLETAPAGWQQRAYSLSLGKSAIEAGFTTDFVAIDMQLATQSDERQKRAAHKVISYSGFIIVEKAHQKFADSLQSQRQKRLLAVIGEHSLFAVGTSLPAQTDNVIELPVSSSLLQAA